MHSRDLSLFIILFLATSSGCGTGSPAEKMRSSIASTGSPIASTGTRSGEGDEATPGSECVSSTALREKALVTYVTDGDSIEVDVGGVPFRVRYIGIDAPEMTGDELGEEAAAANRALVAGKTIVMIRDLSEADRYGRLLRYVFADGIFVNREMVRIGMARAGYYPPDIACTAVLKAAEEEARKMHAGIWGSTGSPTFLTRVGE